MAAPSEVPRAWEAASELDELRRRVAELEQRERVDELVQALYLELVPPPGPGDQSRCELFARRVRKALARATGLCVSCLWIEGTVPTREGEPRGLSRCESCAAGYYGKRPPA